MKMINGRALAAEIREETKRDVSALATAPGLGVLLIGDDPASRVYVGLKEKAAAEVGIKTDIRRLDASTPDADLIEIIRGWNASADVDGIIVQLPLPAGHDENRLIAEIDPKKDVDGFHPENIAALLRGSSTILSPVHEAVLRCIGLTRIDPRGASAAILANSETFAAPLAYLLQRAGFTTAIMHPDALDGELLHESNVIVSAVGRAGFIGRDLVAPGTVIIDVGTSRGADGKIHGDTDSAALAEMDGWMTPVPGGIGPMTVALLLKNVVNTRKSVTR
jgi:methylenetetrahydrofolate dehydrogenase (NADP+) / methenyltetrahydrofolate cyclohydrolase